MHHFLALELDRMFAVSFPWVLAAVAILLVGMAALHMWRAWRDACAAVDQDQEDGHERDDINDDGHRWLRRRNGA